MDTIKWFIECFRKKDTIFNYHSRVTGHWFLTLFRRLELSRFRFLFDDLLRLCGCVSLGERWGRAARSKHATKNPSVRSTSGATRIKDFAWALSVCGTIAGDTLSSVYVIVVYVPAAL